MPTIQITARLFDEVDLSAAADEVHNGYFSIDRRGGWTDTAENNQTNRDNAERAYNLIMKEKEKLLSLETPLKFIFSHSALREGWDNPNVFQICALRDMRTERDRRQTIGRGLRLCVNQKGERLRGFQVNTLTVVAMESYGEFAENLQREIEHDTGIRFGVVQAHQFAAIPVAREDGQTTALGFGASQAFYEHLRAAGYIDAQGRIRDSLRKALRDSSFDVPARFAASQDGIVSILRKLAGRLDVKDADDRKPVRPRQAVLDSPEFRALWDRIKHKTSYRVAFDNEDMLEKCTSALRGAPVIPKTRLQWRKADIAVGQAGVEATATAGAPPIALEEVEVELPDLLTELQDRTQLTRRSIFRILTESRRLGDFRRNPQQFIELAAQSIDRCKRAGAGGRYQVPASRRRGVLHPRAFREGRAQRLSEEHARCREVGLRKGHYESDTEARFADQLEKNTAVKVYTKLPGWFSVNTARQLQPRLGNSN